VILAYKKHHIKKVKGEPEWVGELGEKEDKNGVMKPKTFYTDEQKREFIDLVFGQWKYFADTRSMTKATFSMDIPTKAIKILTYKNDVVLDPFAGSGTTLVAAETLDRQWIGIELSPDYAEVARKRVNTFVLEKRQQVIEM
jgi:site-specific DNA-methyltransferase (adenine-specific)